MSLGSNFRIEPNPPVAGKSANIFYTGDEKEVVYQVAGQGEVRVKVPPKKIPIDPVPSGEHLFVEDGSGPPAGEADWPIIEQSGG